MMRVLAKGFALLSLLSVGAAGPLSARPVALELLAAPAELRECEPGEVEVAVSMRNPDRIPVAGLQVFLRYPAALFEPVAYRPREMHGFARAEGPAPFGSGYPGCDLALADPWDDGRGLDVVSAAASAYGDGEGAPLDLAQAVLGAFAFRLRPGAAPPLDPALFTLEFDPCSSSLQQGNALYDPAGRSLDVTFARPQASVRVIAGVVVEELTCTADPAGKVKISWSPPPAPVSGVNVYRSGSLIRALVLPSVRSIVDGEAPAGGQVSYELAVVSGGREDACRARCTADLSGVDLPFVRGDANGDGRRNIADPVALLGYLYGGQTLFCPDGADFDDSGELELSDAVNLLHFLFLAGHPPSPPSPVPGADPTPDSLGCSAPRA